MKIEAGSAYKETSDIVKGLAKLAIMWGSDIARVFPNTRVAKCYECRKSLDVGEGLEIRIPHKFGESGYFLCKEHVC